MVVCNSSDALGLFTPKDPCFADVLTYAKLGGLNACDISLLNLDLDTMPSSFSENLNQSLEIS